jgi:hypothetical protein
VLLIKTLTSSTFKLALICIGIFGSGFLGLLGYIYYLLARQEIGNLDELTRTIETALLAGVALLVVITAVAGVAITRRTVGRIEAINATSRAIMQSGLDQRIPLRGTRDEWD